MAQVPSAATLRRTDRALPRPLGLGRLPPEIVAILAGIVLWEVIGRIAAFPWFPPFTRVIAAGAQLVRSGAIGVNVLASLSSLAIGFGLSLTCGILVGALMGRVPLVETALGPYVNALLAAPSLIFVPILFVLFGVGAAVRVAVVFLYSVFIIIVNTATAVRTTNPQLLEMARSYGAGGPRLFARVILPDALPLTMAGVRLGMSRGVKGMINGEMLIAYIGLGAQLRTYGGAFDASSVLAIVLLITVIAAVASWLVQVLDRRLTWWAD
ncbi:MAG: ABC transporter permease [Armatimonadota bacterium]